MIENNYRQYISIDFFKMIGAFLVVAIHTSPLLSISTIANFYFVDIVCRLAVPFFFATSGFFFFRKLEFREGRIVNNSRNKTLLKKQMFRLLRLYIVWSAVYLAWQIPYWKSIGWTGVHAVIDYGVSLFFKGSYYHFWYLISLIYGIVILYFLLQKIGIWKTACLSVVFYLIKCIIYGYSWINIPYIENVLSIYNVISGVFDAVCLAIPFMIVGVLATQENKALNIIIRHKNIGLLISVVLLVVEASMLFFASPNTGKYSYIFFTLPTCFFFFCFVKELSITRKYSDSFMRCVRRSSMFVYCVHPLFINVFNLIPGFAESNSLLRYIVILGVSVLVTGVYLFIYNRLRKNLVAG